MPSSESIILTLKVALCTTFLLLLISTPLAWWVIGLKKKYRILIESLLALPLILPPTVLGFYLLIILNPNGMIATFFKALGHSGQLTFNFTGLVIGSVIYSLPFTVQPLINSFSKVPKIYLDSARLMGASGLDRFRSIVIPLSKSGFVLGGILSFAHTIGEFGVVMMIGGNIPGVTRVVSIDIFNHVEALEFKEAHQLSLIMLLFSLIILIVIYSINSSKRVTND
ncbi:molybdate ABC transporter permease subunit [Halobacteriovorax sp. JY17]|uniref:molybdate ABC transporter permease subunit n=1 Tax=Halobacteriovorax sp. JY17 TaxID=2014617 RepID=UPI000C4E99A7|nr:molybdate ABC transporter permease subunit [Halobacteriovorax sp. JY17]PIK14850.1 MAG: molybdenum ABC transporter permease subunit [Halobacteriovorax sp. JY17]